MSKQRRHKQHKTEHISDIADHISNLPDCILHHILSFMPTEEVVKTSILSTRWKNLWASVPNIDFNDHLFMFNYGRCRPDEAFFVKFVESVLRVHDALNMEKFSLSCCGSYEESQIHSWISYAIMHNVQELDLDLLQTTEDPSMIPLSLFESTSLVSLKIRIDCAIQLPSQVSFPCLKTLHLSKVTFPDDDFAEKLFSGCPVLEELVLLRCCLRNLKNIAISITTLKSLTITDMSYLVVFNDPNSGCNINIDATNLTYFEYIGFLSNEIILSNTSSLEKSFIDILDPRARQNQLILTRRANDLLNQLQHVVSLRLSNDTLKKLAFTASIRVAVLPNLTHLILLTMEIENDTFRVLMDLLSCCPVLQSICFSEGFMNSMQPGENGYFVSLIPICMSNCLKKVTFMNFHGYKSEICFLKHVLKYACVLERMDIWWSKTELQYVKGKREVRKEMENIERSSRACVINFS